MFSGKQQEGFKLCTLEGASHSNMQDDYSNTNQLELAIQLRRETNQHEEKNFQFLQEDGGLTESVEQSNTGTYEEDIEIERELSQVDPSEGSQSGLEMEDVQ